MQHLWSIATWDQIVTHDAGRAEWVDTPIMHLDIGDLAPDSSIFFEGQFWTVELARDLYLMSAWHLDEDHDGIYFTCIDPHGITLHQEVRAAGHYGQLPL